MKRLLIAVIGIGFLSAGLSAIDSSVETGQKLFISKGCIKCHQIAGKGNKIAPLDGVASKLTETDIKKWLTSPAEMEAKLAKKPVMKMSSMKLDLKPADVDALVAYMKTLK